MASIHTSNPYYRVGYSSNTTGRLKNSIHDSNNNKIYGEKDFDVYEGRPRDDWYYSDYDE